VEEGLMEQGADLLQPVYYGQRSTRYIENGMNFLLSLRGK